MKLSEIAETLAAPNWPEAEQLHIQMRNPLFKALLQGKPGRTKNSPADYPPEELIRARLLVSAALCGMTTPELAALNQALNMPPAPGAEHAPSAQIEGVVHYPSGLASIIRGAKAGEEWVISLRFTMRDGAREVHPIVSFGPNVASDEEGARTLDLLEGRQALGTLILPASELVKPLLPALEN